MYLNAHLRGVEVGNPNINSHINNVNFINCVWDIEGATKTQNLFLLQNNSSSINFEFNVIGLTVKSVSKNFIPDYILKLNGSSKVKGKFELINTNYTLDEINIIGSFYSSLFEIILPKEVFRTVGRVTINGNGGNVYKFTIANKSPFGINGRLPSYVNEIEATNYIFKSRVVINQNGIVELTITSNELIQTGTNITLGYFIGNIPYL